MIGKTTHVVDCRETMGMGEGGGIAQRGTFAECGSEVLAIAMSPGRRHITKPVCEITFALREANIQTSTLSFKCRCWRTAGCPISGFRQSFWAHSKGDRANKEIPFGSGSPGWCETSHHIQSQTNFKTCEQAMCCDMRISCRF